MRASAPKVVVEKKPEVNEASGVLGNGSRSGEPAAIPGRPTAAATRAAGTRQPDPGTCPAIGEIGRAHV